MTLHERAAALGALARGWERAAAGGGSLVLVRGEAGLGKTALTRAFADGVDAPVLWGGCEPLGAGRPLGPVHDFATRAGGDLAAVMVSSHGRHEAFTAVLEHLARVPSVAVLEDLHWADDATLDLVLFLARRLDGTRSLVIGTLRDDEAVQEPRLARVLGHLGTMASVEHVVLPPLSPEAVARLTGDSGLDAAEVHRLSGGNPFLATELVSAGRDGGVPRSIRDAVLGRAALLPTGARAALDLAAVVPERVELEVLYAVTGASPADLEVCERSGLLLADGRTAAYRHEIARRVVEDALPGARRRELHRAVADHLARRPDHPAARISYHADLAGDADQVLAFAPLAATEAGRVGAHRQACVHLERALRHLDRLPAREQADLLARSATEHDRIGASGVALEHSERAIATYAASDDSDGLAAQLARHATLLWAVARAEEARATAAEAVRVGAAEPDSLGLVTALTVDGTLRMLARDAEGAIGVGARAIELSRGRGEASLLARALNSVGSAHWIAGRYRLGEELLLESLAVSRRAQDDERVGSAMINLGSSAGECRQYGVARRWLAECHEWCRQRDLVGNAEYSRAWLARVALEQGEWDQVPALAAGPAANGNVISVIVAQTALARLGVRRGEPDDALLGSAWTLAARTDDLQRLWPAAATLAEAAWLRNDLAAIPGLVRDTYARAVALRHAWSVGELGYWLWRAGALTDPSPVLEHGAPPYAAQVAGDPARAAALWDELGCPYDGALARAETADPAQVAEAVRVLDRLGARPAADRAAERLRRLGGAVRRARRTTATNPAGLTDRELEVLRSLADGLTNAEIAARMHISVKTAGHHVSAVLAKLGVRSRREAARAAATLRKPEAI